MIKLLEFSKIIVKISILIFLLFFVLTIPAYAIPAPPVIINVGFTAFEIVVLIAFSVVYLIQFLLYVFSRDKNQKLQVSASTIIIMLVFLLIGAVFSGKIFVDHLYEGYYNLAKSLYTIPYESDLDRYPQSTLYNPEKKQDVHKISDTEASINNEQIADKLFSEDAVFIDIRRNREFLACSVKNAINIPADQLEKDIEQFKDKEIFLLGYGVILHDQDTDLPQIAENLRAKGYNAWYIKEGIQTMAQRGCGQFLRTESIDNITMMPRFFMPSERPKWGIPQGKLTKEDYANLDILSLNKPETLKIWKPSDLAKKKNLLIIDTRADSYRVVSDKIHNIPIAKMEIGEIENAVTKIPKDREIVIACNNLFTNFESMWLGAKLNKMGYKYIGRFTDSPSVLNGIKPAIPVVSPNFDFVVSATAYVQASLENIFHLDFIYENEDESTNIAKLRLLIAFVLLILILRVALFPLNFLRYRSRWNTIRAMDQNHNNLSFWEKIHINANNTNESLGIKILKVLPDIAIFIACINSINMEVSFNGVPVGNNIVIPNYVFGFVFAAAFYIYELSDPIFHNKSRIKVIFNPALIIITLALLFASLYLLPFIITVFLAVNYTIAATGIYLTFRILGTRTCSNKKVKTKRLTESIQPCEQKHIVEIGELNCCHSVGGKAHRLSVLLKENLPVPKGFVITSSFFDKLTQNGKISEEGLNLLNQAWNQSKINKAIARSSASVEDGCIKSFAGIFKSINDIDKSVLPQAVMEIHNSFDKARSLNYNTTTSFEPGNRICGGIIIQEKIDYQWSGVVFTSDPQDPTLMSVDIYKHQQGISPDSIAPIRILIGKISGKILSCSNSAFNPEQIQMEELYRLCTGIETLFEYPQDIEWAQSQKGIHIFQSRDITFTESEFDPVVVAEKQRLLQKAEKFSDKTIWESNVITETLPFPTPSSLSLFRKVWSNDGPIADAFGSLGIFHKPDINSEDLIETIFGKLYINKYVEKKLLPNASFSDKLSFLLAKAALEFNKKSQTIKILSSLNFRNAVHSKNVYHEGMSFSELTDHLDEHLNFLLNRHIREVFRINIMLDYCMKWVEKDLEGSGIIFADLIPNNPDFTIDCQKPTIQRFEQAAITDYELASPNHELPDLVIISYEDVTKKRDETMKNLQTHEISGLKNYNRIKRNIEMVITYTLLREYARNITDRIIADIREIIYRIGLKFRLGTLVFFLTIDEIRSPQTQTDMFKLKEIINQRRKERQIFENINLPVNVGIEEIEAVNIKNGTDIGKTITDHNLFNNDLSLIGMRVSGRKEVVTGKVVILEHFPLNMVFSKDQIIVTRLATTDWYKALPCTAAIITEGGGMLSHLAILAREQGATYIAGCKGAASNLKTGDEIMIMPNGQIIINQAKSNIIRS